MASRRQLRVAIGTNALGKSKAGHDLPTKLQAAKRHGFDGVEIVMECLESYSQSALFDAYGDGRVNRLQAAAKEIRRQVTDLSLEIVTLNPFGAYDGLAEEEDILERLEEAEIWLQVLNILDGPILQIASCIYPLVKPLTSDPVKIASNMKRLCLLAQKYNKQVAYEAVAWGIDVNRWQQIRDVLALVDLPNMKYCLDTFHIAAKEAGDPFNKGAPIRPGGLSNVQASLEEMQRTLKVSDIGYFQLSDALVADKNQEGYPMKDLNQPPYMTQSRNCRIYPCEDGVLPCLTVAKTVFDMGYRGWVTMEVFHTDMWKPDKSIPDEWARRGIESWRNVLDHCFEDRQTTQSRI